MLRLKRSLVAIEPSIRFPITDVRGPSEPIPEGYADCYGQWNDPDATECQKCLVAEDCALVMKKRFGGNMPGDSLELTNLWRMLQNRR